MHVSHASGKLVIVRSGQRLSIEPPCPEILEALTTKVWRPVDDDQHGCRVVTVVEPLLDPIQPPQLLLPDQRLPVPTAGLEPIVRCLARKGGRKVAVRWHSPPPSTLPKPDPKTFLHGRVIWGTPEDTMAAEPPGMAVAAVKSHDADPGSVTDFFPASHYYTPPPHNRKPLLP